MSVSFLNNNRPVQNNFNTGLIGSAVLVGSVLMFLYTEKESLLIKVAQSIVVGGGGSAALVAGSSAIWDKCFSESPKKPQGLKENRKKKPKKVTFDETKNKVHEIEQKVKEKRSSILDEFQLVNKWTHKDKSVVDETTGRLYLNDSEGTVRFKCLALCVGTPIVHLVAGVLNIAYRVIRLISGFHFWKTVKDEREYDFEVRCEDFKMDVLKIVANPFALIGLELAALYGIFMPYDGRKLYASIERSVYGGAVLAPCFQPNAQKHLFGGDINTPNVW